MEIDRLIRSRRRSVSLEITDEGELVVRAPNHLSRKKIEQLVMEHEQWIDRKKQEILVRPKKVLLRLEEGECLLFQGSQYRLHLDRASASVDLKEDQLLVPALSTVQERRNNLEEWYRNQAKSILLPRLKALADQFGFAYAGGKITSATTRWGSCSGKNSICLSWHLVMVPPAVADSVIIHELCHTVFHDHSSSFWSLVEKVMPDYRQHREWLKHNRYLVHLLIEQETD